MEIKRSMPYRDRMNKIVECDRWVYLAGLTGTGSDVKEQTKSILEQAEELLEKAGSDKHHILRATIFLSSMDLFNDMNSVWDKWITLETAPARACLEAKLALPELFVEILFDAVKKQ